MNENDLLDQLSVIFSFNAWEITLLLLLGLVLAVQLYYYFAYYRTPLSYAKKRLEELDNEGSSNIETYPMVSVIIEAENEINNLKELLPLLLTQDYPNYEVIVVNNGSSDESDMLLESFRKDHPNLYQTYLSHSQDKNFEFRKLALTLGVKAAKGDILLFTEAYCRPASDKWIQSMVYPMLTEENKDIVLGYSYYRKKDSLLDRIISFDNLIFGLQYLSAAIKGKPYTGVFRNLAFKKQLFFDNKGFAAHLYLDNCEEVFVNEISTPENTTVCAEQAGFIQTLYGRYSRWKRIKKSYSIARSRFKGFMANFFSIELFSRYLFYSLFIVLLVHSILMENWGLLGVTSLFFLVREISQLIILNKAAQHFKTGEFYLVMPLVDIFQPFFNTIFRTRPQSIIR